MSEDNFANSIMEFLNSKELKQYTVNGNTFYNKTDAINTLLELITSQDDDGDIVNGKLNIDNANKFKRACDIAYKLCNNVGSISIDFNDKNSIAMCWINCAEVMVDKHDCKYSNILSEFDSLISFLAITKGSAAYPHDTQVVFSVSDVFYE